MGLINCPVCNGSGKRYDTDTAEWTDEPCTACHGSCKLETSAREWQAIANQKRPDRANGWTLEERNYLRDLHGQGVAYKQIAILLGKSMGAVSSMMNKMKRRGEW